MADPFSRYMHSDAKVGYFSCSQNELSDIFEKAGFDVISSDIFEFTANNQQFIIHGSF